MARTVSDEFKAIWAAKVRKGYKLRIGYKRRYWSGAAFVLESSYNYLYEQDFVGVGTIPWAIDSQQQNVIKSSVVTLSFKNIRNEWKQSAAVPSIFAADDTATDGYRLFKSEFIIQCGYELSSGSTEWVTEFTSIALGPKMTGSGVAAIRVMSKAALQLEKSDPGKVSTTFTLEDCIPATGDGSNKDFESTSLGVNDITDLQVNAVTLSRNSYSVSNTNQIAIPGNTGRVAFALTDAPLAGQTVKCSGRKWLQNQELGVLLGLLADQAGVLAAQRTIGSITIPSATGFKEVDSVVEWDADDSRVNIDTAIEEGSGQQQFHSIADFSAAGHSEWSTLAGGTYTSDAGYLGVGTGPLGGPGSASAKAWKTYTTTALATVRTIHFSAQVSIESTASPDEVAYIKVMVTNRGHYGIVFSQSGSCYFGRQTAGVWTSLKSLGANPTSGGVAFRITIDSSGTFELWRGGISQGTVSEDPVPTVLSYVIEVNAVAFGTDYNLVMLTDAQWAEGAYGDSGSWSTSDNEIVYIFDLASVPTAMGRITYVGSLNGGTLTFQSAGAVDSGGSPGAWDALVTTDSDGQMNHTAKQWLKIRVKFDDATTRYAGPVVQSFRAEFYTTEVIISLANLGTDASCGASIEAYLKMIDYEGGDDPDGKLFIRSKDVSMESVVHLTQENGIIDVLDYDDGRDRVVTVGKVQYGSYVAEYDAADAGESSPTCEEEYGRVLPPGGGINLGTRALANDVDIAAARAQIAFERGHEPRIRLRLSTWLVPWLDISDKVTVTVADQSIMLHAVANDPCARVGSQMVLDTPQNILANALEMKVLEYKPNYDTGHAEILAEEIL